MPSPRRLAKQVLLWLVGAITGRHVALLPNLAQSRESIFRVHAPYRVDDELAIELLDDATGRLQLTLLGYQGHFPTNVLWSREVDYHGRGTLRYRAGDGAIGLDEKTLGTMPLPSGGRRFCWDFRLSRPGADRERRTSHYLSRPTETIDRDYFEGSNYVDHAAETLGQSARILELMAGAGAVGPVLEVGCATGGFLEALGAMGIDGYGVDISEWAVARASETLGPGRVFRCDAELDPLPAELVAKGPFRTFILWAVFEHFRDPFRVLAKLSEVAAPGGALLLNTTNADSLCHRVFGQEWEGYFDGSHHGIDRVSVDSVRRELAALGWRIERMETDVTWDRSADPLHATLREWWHADARFRQLLVEKELGDFLLCVATKT